MTVQRHNAASRSTNPSSTAQHLLAGGVPITRWTSPPKRSAHAPSFSASFGHFAGGAGAGALGGDLPQAQSVVAAAAENAVKKRRLVMRRTAVNLLLITAAMAAAVESVLSGFFWVRLDGVGGCEWRCGSVIKWNCEVGIEWKRRGDDNVVLNSDSHG
ncbi:unnamed protein product [Linum tenue]|uniref:Uncharacterized protein n=2 Tax=Linum tenue TaxID=586396 RepID=A0AAV0JYZ5_9ROSI|nr:unnamed protein product [Linum tenue]